MMPRHHNEKTEQELYEEQQFVKGFADLKSLESEMAGTKGEIGGLYKRLKAVLAIVRNRHELEIDPGEPVGLHGNDLEVATLQLDAVSLLRSVGGGFEEPRLDAQGE